MMETSGVNRCKPNYKNQMYHPLSYHLSIRRKKPEPASLPFITLPPLNAIDLNRKLFRPQIQPQNETSIIDNSNSRYQRSTPTSKSRRNGPELSTLADMARYQQQSVDFIDKFIEMARDLQETRKKWQDEVNELNSIIGKLQEENHKQRIVLKSIQTDLASEIKSKKQLQKDYDCLRKKMKELKELVIGDNATRQTVDISLISLLGCHDRRSPDEDHQPDDDDDGLLFHKSVDDDIYERSKVPKPVQQEMSKSSNNQIKLNILTPVPETCKNVSPESTKPVDHKLKSTSSTLTKTPNNKSGELIGDCQKFKKFEPERLKTKPHRCTEKKAIRSVNCSVCNKAIGFFKTFTLCVQCHGVAHKRCASQLPKPCLPPITASKAINKMLAITSQHPTKIQNQISIVDFVDKKTGPYVPALLIHCCNEIERRINLAINGESGQHSSMVGLYRVCGVQSEILALRNKILEARNGVPNLSSIIDVHTICGVVKLFLRLLDDSLITKVYWARFYRCAENLLQAKPKRIDPDSGMEWPLQSDFDDEENKPMTALKEVVFRLPLSHRHTLAFMMLHLKSVANGERVTKMTTTALSNIFGPVIVGDSGFEKKKPKEMMAEYGKQVSIMQALFMVQDSFWNDLLTQVTFKMTINLPRLAQENEPGPSGV